MHVGWDEKRVNKVASIYEFHFNPGNWKYGYLMENWVMHLHSGNLFECENCEGK